MKLFSKHLLPCKGFDMFITKILNESSLQTVFLDHAIDEYGAMGHRVVAHPRLCTLHFPGSWPSILDLPSNVLKTQNHMGGLNHVCSRQE